MFDQRRCLFSYSTRITDAQYVNDFSHDGVYRYTINALIGIQQAQLFYDLDWDTDEILNGFLRLHWSSVRDAADNGLLLYVLAVAGHPAQRTQMDRIERLVRDERSLSRLDLQQVCWMLAGLTKHAELTCDPRSVAAAEVCWKFLQRCYLNRRTLLPRYSGAQYRMSFTSFGGIAYFLWSIQHYARVFGDEQARTTFRDGVRQVIGLQGSQGEWPWFINANDATVLDWYQVYSVHQDAMSMLFLFPALDSGISEASTAIEKSYRWLFGHNQLRVPMIRNNPLLIYRSIRRKTTLERERRYLKALAFRTFRLRAQMASPSKLEVNQECRSYHIGWLLFAWSGRRDFAEFSELRLLQ